MQPQWTERAMEMALRYILNLSPNTAPTTLYLSLWVTTADPSGSGTEVADPSYARQALTWDSSGTTTFSCTTAGSPTFNFTNAGSFVGVRLMDASSGGNTMFWQDFDSVYNYDAGASVPVLAAAMQVGLVNQT